jgi:hypothetical protein
MQRRMYNPYSSLSRTARHLPIPQGRTCIFLQCFGGFHECTLLKTTSGPIVTRFVLFSGAWERLSHRIHVSS